MKYFLAFTGILMLIASTGQFYGLFNQDYPPERGILAWFIWSGLAILKVYPELEKRKRVDRS